MTESFRDYKTYLKIFAVGVFLLVLAITLLMVRNLYAIYADPSTPGEYEDYVNAMATLLTLFIFFMQLGIVLFILASFMGAVSDERLSPEVRRGMVLATSITIIAFALLMIYSIPILT
jgi:uncharacterized membrane protein (DUF485 family)